MTFLCGVERSIIGMRDESFVFSVARSLHSLPIMPLEWLKHFLSAVSLGQPTGFVQIGPEKWILPDKFKSCANEIYNFQARSSDVYICTYPRSGTTWTQEMIWLICNDLDYETAQKRTLNERFPFFEWVSKIGFPSAVFSSWHKLRISISPDLFRLSRLNREHTTRIWHPCLIPFRFHLYMHDQMKATFLTENADEQWKMDFIEKISVPGYKFLPEMTQQRFVKTHLPFKILPPSIMEKRSKVIYMARHPASVVVSYYHLNKLYRTQGYVNDFNTFFEYFMKDLCELKYFPCRVPCENGANGIFKTVFSAYIISYFLSQYTGVRTLNTLKMVGSIVTMKMFYFFFTKI